MDMPVYKATEQDAVVRYRNASAAAHRYAFNQMEYHKGRVLDREYIVVPILSRETMEPTASVKIDVQLLEAGIIYHETSKGLEVCLTGQQMVVIGLEVERGRAEARGTGLKTLDGWEESGLPTVEDYVEQGDEVDEEMVDYFLNALPPRTLTGSLMQAGGAISDVRDDDGRWRTTFLTFKKTGSGHWYFTGRCFAGSFIPQQAYTSSLERMIINRYRLIAHEANESKQEA